MKKISFVIPSFNCAAWLPHAVESCRIQTYKNIEIVIVDDCSTDSTGQYISWLTKQNDKRIVYRRNSVNIGRSLSRNLGNELATGEIICVLDSDDLAVLTRAEWTLKKLQHCQVCYGSAVAMDALGNILYEINAKPIDKETCLKTKQNEIVHSTVAYSKELCMKYPYAMGRISDLGLDDWEQQIRMLVAGISFDFIPDVICAYRVHTMAVTQTRNQAEVDKIKKEVLGNLNAKPESPVYSNA